MRGRSKISQRLQGFVGDGGGAALPLTLKVTESAGRELLNLDFPAESIRLLASILPEKVRQVIEGLGINLNELESKFNSNLDWAPGPVLACAEPRSGQSIVLFLH